MTYVMSTHYAKFKLVLLVIILAFCQNGHSQDVTINSETLSAMTFNIRCDVAKDGLNSWIYRKEALVETIKKYDPDIVGMQEVVHNQLLYLNDNLDEYTFYGVGRQDGKDGGEYCPIYYKESEFELLDEGTFALSRKPEIIGSKSWGAAIERIATYVVLRRRQDKAEIVVFNTHYDHKGKWARIKSSKLLRRKMKEIAKERPVVLMGDFNVEDTSRAIKSLLKYDIKNARDISNKVIGPDWSFHLFGNLKEEDRSMIDYIFVSNDIKVADYIVIDEKVNNKYISDHCPIMIKLYFENNLWVSGLGKNKYCNLMF